MNPSAESLDRYKAVREAVGWRDLPHLGKIRVAGPDGASFLHAMLSNDVQSLGEFGGRYGTLLKATGKIVADFHYYRLPNEFFLEIESKTLDLVMEHLSAHIIMDDVALEDVSARYHHLAVEGPRAEILLERAGFREPPAAPLSLRIVPWREEEVAVVRRNRLSDTGWDLWLPKESRVAVTAALEAAGEGLGLRRVDEDAFQALRIERGIPLFGIDFSDRNNPIEARLDAAYSLTKVCYPGQEVLNRATHIGGVARTRVCLLLDGGPIPQAGARIHTGEGEEAGWITSAAFSPLRGVPVAMGYLKRAAAIPGNGVTVETGENARSNAEVVERFD